MKAYHDYVREARRKGHSYLDIAKHMKQNNYPLSFILKIFLTLDLKRNLEISGLFAILLIFAGGLVFTSFNAPTGFVTYENITTHSYYAGQIFTESTNYTFTPEQRNELTSLMLSGDLLGKGAASIYLETGSGEYLIYSTDSKSSGLASVTGNVVAEYKTTVSVPEQPKQNTTPVDNTTTVPPANETVQVNDTVVEDNSTIITQVNETAPINDTVPVDANATVPDTNPTAPPVEQAPALNATTNETTAPKMNITVPEENVTVNVTQPANETTVIRLDQVCGEACVLPSLNESNYTIKIVLNNMIFSLETIDYTLRFEANISEPENMSLNVSENITSNISANVTGNVSANITANITENVSQTENITTANITVLEASQVVINQPVYWKVEVDTNVTNEIMLPKESFNITVNDTANVTVENTTLNVSDYNKEKELEILKKEFPDIFSSAGKSDVSVQQVNDIALKIRALEAQTQGIVPTQDIVLELPKSKKVQVEYYTEGPAVHEDKISKAKKIVTVSSDLHYKDILAYTALDMEVPQDRIDVVWLNNGQRTKVDAQYLDENNNGLIDKVQWIVPHLSNESYEISINILNVQSYPMVGGYWTVDFETVGTADLNISAISGTVYDVDLVPDSLTCDNTPVSAQRIGNSILVSNFSCNGTAHHKVKVLTKGSHHQLFDFGGALGYANNYAAALPKTLNIQGKLVNSTGGLVNSTKSMTFKIYDQFTGGSELWSETLSVPVSAGIYDVILGYTNPLNLPFNVSYYLGINVAGDGEMVPRLNLTNSPYSYSAYTANDAYNVSCSNCLTGYQIDESSLVGVDADTLDTLDSTAFCQSTGANCPASAIASTPWTNNSNEIYTTPGYPTNVNITGQLRIDDAIIERQGTTLIIRG